MALFLAPSARSHFLNVGSKWAFLNNEQRVATFQLRTFIPTGNPLKVLSTGHAAVEPGLLLFQPLAEGWFLEGEFKGWIPLSENGFAGNILNYGLGVSYRAYDSPKLRVAPACEVVGWTVLTGKETLVGPNGIPRPSRPRTAPAASPSRAPPPGGALDTGTSPGQSGGQAGASSSAWSFSAQRGQMPCVMSTSRLSRKCVSSSSQ
jgi:hypothetical protein